MCRFAVVSSKEEFALNQVLEAFADLSKKNPAPDGDKQEDGWGVVFRENDNLKLFKSTAPIWEEDFSRFNQQTSFCMLHSRSATFPTQKNRLDLNQPYISGKLLYVFNGAIKGVNLRLNLYGEVGARKFLSLIERFLRYGLKPELALEKAAALIKRSSRRIYGLNIAFVLDNFLYLYSICSQNPDYYRLYFYSSKDFFMLSSASGLFANSSCQAEFQRKKFRYNLVDFDKVLKFEIFK